MMRGSLKSFWLARMARLYPVYLLGMLMFVPFIYRDTNASVIERVTTGLLTLVAGQAWPRGFGWQWGMWNPPGWSLSAEAFFYLVFPFVSVSLSRWSTRGLLIFALGCWAVSMLATVQYAVTGSADRELWMFFPLMRLPEFLIGVAAGIVWKNRASSAFDELAPHAAVFSSISLIAVMSLSIKEEWYFNGVVAPLAAVLICSLACNRGLVARILSCRPLVVLGGASFSLYILHWPIWLVAQHVFGRSVIYRMQPNLYFVAYFACATAASYVCFKYVEEPMNKLLRKRFLSGQSRDLATDTDKHAHREQPQASPVAANVYGSEAVGSSSQIALMRDEF